MTALKSRYRGGKAAT